MYSLWGSQCDEPELRFTHRLVRSSWLLKSGGEVLLRPTSPVHQGLPRRSRSSRESKLHMSRGVGGVGGHFDEANGCLLPLPCHLWGNPRISHCQASETGLHLFAACVPDVHCDKPDVQLDCGQEGVRPGLVHVGRGPQVHHRPKSRMRQWRTSSDCCADACSCFIAIHEFY